MKKLSIKKISIFIIVVCIVVSIIYWQNRKNSFEYRKKQYIQELLCVPEKPIDKGIIYAEAMKQYWNWEMDYIWYRYEQWKQGEHPGGEYDASLDAEREKRKCGLEENIWGKRWFSKDYCYPHVVMKNGTIKVYRPEQDDYLYKPEYYNKDVDFTVYINGNISPESLSHKEDCCKLLTYDEMKEDVIKKQNDNVEVYQKFDLVDNEDILKRMYFLKIRSSSYYPVSQCGKVPYFTYFSL